MLTSMLCPIFSEIAHRYKKLEHVVFWHVLEWGPVSVRLKSSDESNRLSSYKCVGYLLKVYRCLR
jgi:hypothetical protein